MERWISIAVALVAVLLGIVFPLIARRKKKEDATNKLEKLHRHLQMLGMEVSSVEKINETEQTRLAHA